MNALAGKAIEVRLVAELRLLPPGGKPNMREIRLAIAAELGACSPAQLAAAVTALRYAGKLAWDSMELSDSMRLEAGGARASVPAAEGPENSGEIAPTPSSGPEITGSAGPDDDDGPDEDCPGDVNDATPAARPLKKTPGGWTKAANLAGSRPIPAPAHEPEVARQVREECNANFERRRQARSTGTVRQPLEVRKFGVPGMNTAETVSSLLVETPHDLMVAIDRRHSALWKRVLLLARGRDERPAQALYAALEAGLAELEADQSKLDERTVA